MWWEKKKKGKKKRKIPAKSGKMAYKRIFLAACPRSLDPFHIVSYYIKWVKTSRTYRNLRNFAKKHGDLPEPNGINHQSAHKEDDFTPRSTKVNL